MCAVHRPNVKLATRREKNNPDPCPSRRPWGNMSQVVREKGSGGDVWPTVPYAACRWGGPDSPQNGLRGRLETGHLDLLAVDQLTHARPDVVLPGVVLVDRLVQVLPLLFALEATQPDEQILVLLTEEHPGDHHPLGDLERNDLLLHQLLPRIALAGPHSVLP